MRNNVKVGECWQYTADKDGKYHVIRVTSIADNPTNDVSGVVIESNISGTPVGTVCVTHSAL